MTDADPFSFGRFITAQQTTFAAALEEIRAGRKRSHWMWFIFPQLRGLGHSSMAALYGIDSLPEARAYLRHPVLGPRLLRCTQAMLAVEGRTLHEIFGTPDDVKFRSCMTLFALATDEEKSPFHQALALYCDGRMDGRTLVLLKGKAESGDR